MFLVAGEALYDVFPGAPLRRGAIDMRAVVGGSPFNVAIGLARQGEEVALLAGVSTDPLGEGLAAHLIAEGVRADYLCRKPNPTTLALVALDAQGLPRYAFYGHEGADVALTAQDLPAPGAALSGVHVGSYALVRAPAADTLAQLVAGAAGGLVTLDPNVRPTVEPDMGVWRRRIAALIPHAAVVKASDEDLARLAPGEPIDSVARGWLAAGPALVVVTRGAEGVAAFTRAHALRLPAAPVAVVDTVGAGDTFQATLIAGLLRAGARRRDDVAALAPAEIERILVRAGRAAAITCGRRGADLPTAAEIDAVAG
ncbi:MAG: carbohydrate kinase [Methylobacteriaceae bacterium]|nr:carbohydrate kinase [Methylobacteriaceae bacterium]